jgi:anhydro-N-acetylmuramic acid kinase
MGIYHVIGIMSGTSLDGVDLAHTRFDGEDKFWDFEIKNAVTIPYNDVWKDRLGSLHSKDAFTFAKTHIEYGRFLGELVKKFVIDNNIKADFVSSHGHTIFHQPEEGVTNQIGDGAAISAECGLPVVCDFRITDVALGGQGAPLVPIGDKLLFSEYEYCLNLGGIANISYEEDDERVAFDICPVNIVLNHLSRLAGKNFDEGGTLAAKGKLNIDLLEQLNDLPYYSKSYPKSLGREDIEKFFLPLIDTAPISIEDKLCTFCEHIAIQISFVINRKHQGQNKNFLITGGGAFNQFLIQRLKNKSEAEIIIPAKSIIEFKEALIFALLGVLRWRGEINCLKSVTGAEKDSCSGAIYFS